MADRLKSIDPDRRSGHADPTTVSSPQLNRHGLGSLMALADRSLDPLFWRAERLGTESAWWEHVPFAHWLVCTTAPRVLVELGTHSGVSYSAFCNAVVRAGLGTRCHAVDTWQGDRHANLYGPEILADLRAFHDERFGAFSTLLQCTFDEALDYIDDGSVDLLHVDGLHTYEAVQHDFESWLPKLSDRAVVLFHDINVRRDDFGVWRLWAELRGQYPTFDFVHGYGLGVLAVGKETPAPVAALCGLTDPTEIAAIRARFARLGEHWWTETHKRMVLLDLGRHAGAAAEARAALAQRDSDLAQRTAELHTAQEVTGRTMASLRATSTRLSEVEQECSELRDRAEEAETEAVESGNLAATLQTEEARLRRELGAVVQSTFWRMTGPARRATSLIPASLRRHGRNTARVAYWVITPHRTRNRIAFFRARRAARHLAASTTETSSLDGPADGDLPSASTATTPIQLSNASYEQWIQKHDSLSETDRQKIRRHIDSLPAKPLFSVVMPVYEANVRWLHEAVASVRSQLYPFWELCIADDASQDPGVVSALTELSASDPRIRCVRREKNGHIAVATNSALELATGEFIALMDHDDILAERALYEVAVELNAHPDSDLIFSDEDQIDNLGRRQTPYFKPEWNLDLFLGHNMVNHLGVYRRALVKRLGGMRVSFEGSQDYDLALRVVAATDPDRIRHIPAILYHWRQPGGTSFSEVNLERCAASARIALAEYLRSAEQSAEAEVTPHPALPGWTRVRWRISDAPPRVSVIVPTRDRADLVARCVAGVLHRTDYNDIELIIVDNDSVKPETATLFQGLGRDPRVTILHFGGEFNYSAMNNRAVEGATGEVVVLLNNDIDIIGGDWLLEMVSHVLRPKVGAVGAKLLFADNTIQHAGVALGIGSYDGGPGVAAHIGRGMERDDPGYFGQNALVREVSACTGACLAMKRDIYMEVGGLDEAHLPVAFNDIDLCIRVRQQGYKIIWTPFAELYHLESASRGPDNTPAAAPRFRKEVQYMRERWGMLLDNDPFYNQNFSRANSDFALASPPLRGKPWRNMT